MKSQQLNLTYFNKCIDTLELAFVKYNNPGNSELEKQLYRSACVKEFEIILELSAILLKKTLKDYFADISAVNRLSFKNVFRQWVQFSIIKPNDVEEWISFRDVRNQTSHEYDENHANELLKHISKFIELAKRLSKALESND